MARARNALPPYYRKMKLRQYRFCFRWAPTLVLALSLPLFVALGLWQLDRADERRAQARTMEQRTLLPRLSVGSEPLDPSITQFRRVLARGEFEPDREFYIENRRHAGRNGFYVVTPLRIEGSDMRVLVNRGWIAADASGQPQTVTAPSGRVEVIGVAQRPSPPALTWDRGSAAAWGKRWPYLTVELFAAAAPYRVQGFVIFESPGGPGTPVREWPKEPPKEGMHLGYALQWFAFALIAAVIYLSLSLERREGQA
jgi:surfeit locus 1 family protein